MVVNSFKNNIIVSKGLIQVKTNILDMAPVFKGYRQTTEVGACKEKSLKKDPFEIDNIY